MQQKKNRIFQNFKLVVPLQFGEDRRKGPNYRSIGICQLLSVSVFQIIDEMSQNFTRARNNVHGCLV